MKNLTIHTPSALAGAILLGLVLVASAAVQGGGSLIPGDFNRVKIIGQPAPHEMVQISGDTPYMVPSGKLFVLTGLGRTEIGNFTTQLLVDGALAVSAQPYYQLGNGGDVSGVVLGTTVMHVPVGYTAQAGSTLEVTGSNGGRAWGYLVDA
jgi:hypothetical protein